MRLILSALLILMYIISYAQNTEFKDEKDKCGFDPHKAAEMHSKLGENWGYSFDSLLNDINYWSAFSQVSVTTIGQSTLGREIYELEITENPIAKSTKPRVYIHARTHPGEVQSFWVTDEIINLLIGNSPLGTFMRQQCVFHIVPMFNPDGVELEKPRENANDIDIESNWGSENPEKEVVVLKKRFEDLMQEENPIQIALNMHSAYDCNRYFVFHHENGTSEAFAEKEIDFIESIRQYFINGIKPYDYYISWSNGTPNYYPESWWWNNYGENVMALTYEDMNCSAAGNYDKTAFAIIRGIADYLNLEYVGLENVISSNKLEVDIYPNPFADEISISAKIPGFNVQIFDFAGKLISEENNINTTSFQYDLSDLSVGIYMLRFYNDKNSVTKKIIKR